MALPQKSSGLENFTRLTPSVYIHEPATRASGGDGPELILIAGWMDSTPRYLSKYTTPYQKLYPSARIAAIITTSKDVLSSNETNLKRIAPVLEVLYGLPPDAKCLVHFFSNGGLYTASLIMKAYKAKTGRSIPAKALVFDSAPGKLTYSAALAAFKVGLPKNPLLRLLGIIVLNVAYVLYLVVLAVSGKTDITEQARADANTPGIFDVAIPRLYFYGTGDQIIDYRYIEEHAADAAGSGFQVYQEKYKSGHCAHVLDDGERYWRAVANLWTARDKP